MGSTSLTNTDMPAMNAEQQELYGHIQAFSLDQPDAELSFSQRLAKENDWSLVYAHEAIEEYKKFAFLSVTAEHPVIPSDPIDQVWHLHLTYTRSYWDNFCLELLKQPLHHDPALGGLAEKQHFRDFYSKTLESYQQFFGVEPPARFWPSTQDRFRQDLTFVRVNLGQNLILPYTLLSQGIVATVLFLLTLALSGFYLVSSQGSQNPVVVTLVVGFWVIISFGFIQFVKGAIKAIKKGAIKAIKNRHMPSLPGCSVGLD